MSTVRLFKLSHTSPQWCNITKHIKHTQQLYSCMLLSMFWHVSCKLLLATCCPPACRSVQDVSEVAPVLDFIRQHVAELVAVGEVGLDFSPHVVGKAHSEEEQRLREVQREVFKQQILLANELGLPVNVHSRSAGE
jgi:Tat protein secretion system quality control protein TatD with DNase activity